MKRTVLAFTAALAVVVTSCKKDESSPEENPSSPSSASGFTWTVNGSTVKADSGFFIPAFNNIVAYKNGSSVDIVLSSLSVGTYSISSATGNTLQYETSSTSQGASSGTVGISSRNASNQMTGSFSASFAGSTVTNISGQFIDLPGRN